MSDPDGTSTPVFVSYSHEDKKWLERLQVHLKPLVRAGDIDLWDDTRIRPGADWRAEIDRALATAQVAVLLVSADFLASDFIQHQELPVLLEAAQKRGTRILPVVLSHSLFKDSPLGRFQAVNDPDRPLEQLTKAGRDKALSDLARAIAAGLSADTPAKVSTEPKVSLKQEGPGGADKNTHNSWLSRHHSEHQSTTASPLSSQTPPQKAPRRDEPLWKQAWIRTSLEKLHTAEMVRASLYKLRSELEAEARQIWEDLWGTSAIPLTDPRHRKQQQRHEKHVRLERALRRFAELPAAEFSRKRQQAAFELETELNLLDREIKQLRATLPGGPPLRERTSFPEVLDAEEIASLWTDDMSTQESYVWLILRAISNKELSECGSVGAVRSVGYPMPNRNPHAPKPRTSVAKDGMRVVVHAGEVGTTIPMVHRDDFRSWLEVRGDWPPTGCKLRRWWRLEMSPDASAGISTETTPPSNGSATGGVRQASPGPNPENRQREHRSLGTWILGGLLLAFLFAVFAFAPATLPDYKHRILALCAALLAGLFGWFLSGETGLRIEALKSRFGDLAIRATGGLGLFVVVLVWWLSPLAPVGSGELETPEAPDTGSADVGNGIANRGSQTFEGPVTITGGGSSHPEETPVKPGSASVGIGIANTGEQVIQGPVTIGGAPVEEKR